MAKKEVEIVEGNGNQNGLSLKTKYVEFRVVAELMQNGKFLQHVAAGDNIPEVQFGNGRTIDSIVTAAQKALEEKYIAGR